MPSRALITRITRRLKANKRHDYVKTKCQLVKQICLTNDRWCVVS